MVSDRAAAGPTPAEQAWQLIGRDYLTYSALRTFQACPLRFHFQYVQNRPPEFVAAGLAFGGAVHTAIELHFRRLLAAEPLPTHEVLLDAFLQHWQFECALPVRFAKTENESDLLALAARMLAAFQASPLARPHAALIGVEEELRRAVRPDIPDLLGRVDLIAHDHGVLRIVDFKTSRARWNETNVEEAAPQMLLYAELAWPLAQALGVRTIELDWIVLTKTKDPVVELHTLVPRPEQTARQMNIVRQVWDALRSRHVYPAPSSLNCPACPFQTACQQWDG